MRFPEMRGNDSDDASVTIQNGRGLHRLISRGLGNKKIGLELRIGAHVKHRHAPSQSERPAAHTNVVGAHNSEAFEKTFGEAALSADFQTAERGIVELESSGDSEVLLDGGIQDFKKRFACLV